MCKKDGGCGCGNCTCGKNSQVTEQVELKNSVGKTVATIVSDSSGSFVITPN